MSLQVEDDLRKADKGAARRARGNRKGQGCPFRGRIARREQRGDTRVNGQLFTHLPQRCLIHLIRTWPLDPPQVEAAQPGACPPSMTRPFRSGAGGLRIGVSRLITCPLFLAAQAHNLVRPSLTRPLKRSAG